MCVRVFACVCCRVTRCIFVRVRGQVRWARGWVTFPYNAAHSALLTATKKQFVVSGSPSAVYDFSNIDVVHRRVRSYGQDAACSCARAYS